MIKNFKSIVNNLFNETLRLCNMLRSQALQEEVVFLPVGILLLKWISDSKERFQWQSNFNYNKLLNSDNNYHKDLNQYLYYAVKDIELENDVFEGIFTNLCFSSLDYIKVDYLEEIINTYKKFDFNDLDSEKNITGPFIELFLQYLNDSFYSYSFVTAQPIKQLLARMFNIHENMHIADITCGTGRILSEIINQGNYDNLNTSRINLYGQEINFKIALICKINLILHAVRYPNIKIVDSLKESVSKYYNKKIDIMLSNLPLGSNWYDYEVGDREEFIYDLPNKSNAEWAFIQRGLSSLSFCGKAAFIVSKGTLSRKSERKIRAQIIEDDLIEAVISLPSNLYGTKTIPVEILVINKEKLMKNKILFIDASKEYIKKERGRYDLSEGHINKILSFYRNCIEEEGYSKLVESEEIKNRNFELDSYLYINNDTLQSLKNAKMIKLCDVADVKRGLQVTKSRLTEDKNIGTHYYIKISDIVNDSIEFNEKIMYLSEKEAKSYELKKNDLIISARGALIKTSVYDEKMPPSVFSGNILLIRLKKNYNPYFLKFYFDSKEGKELLEHIQEGATIIALNPNKLKEILVPDVNINNQNELAQRIIENKKEYELSIKIAEDKYNRNLELISEKIKNYIY